MNRHTLRSSIVDALLSGEKPTDVAAPASGHDDGGSAPMRSMGWRGRMTTVGRDGLASVVRVASGAH